MFDAFQSQQRLQKEEERKAKMEASDALQGYRRSGLSEEERKSSALREQERIHKLDAEEQLRGYRGQLTEEEAKMAAHKQEELRRKKELESQLRHNGVVSANDPNNMNNLPLLTDSGRKVSDLAAGYSSPSPLKQPHEYDQQDQQRSTSVTLSMISESSNNDDYFRQPDFDGSTAATTTTDVAVGNNNDRASSITTKEKTETTEKEPMVVVEIPTTNPSKDDEPFTVIPAPAADTPIVTTAPVVVPADENHPPPPPSVHNSTIMFLFGILTADDIVVDFLSTEDRYKLVEGYLARADRIAKSVAATTSKDNSYNNNQQQQHDNTSISNYRASSSSSFESISSTLTYPVAKSIEKDYSRTDVHRTMVTVAISFSAPNQTLAQSFQTQVVERIRDAISDGSFTKVLDDNQ